MTPYGRAVFVARHPAAVARAFDKLISAFLKIVVQFRRGSGLFGTCKAYYATVEAQGCGTLHCHMLLWLDGNPHPQQLRNRMMNSPDFKQAIFSWMEDIIKCELPGMTPPIVMEAVTDPLQDDDEAATDCHIERVLHVTEMNEKSFKHEYQSFVHCLATKCNWHIHNNTCYKHLHKHEIRSNSNCRMRIDGSTRDHTDIDDETLSIRLRHLHLWINNYNDVVLFLIQSNMDIKYVGSGPAAKALVYYVTDYITKSSLKIHAGIHTLEAALKSHTEVL